LHGVKSFGSITNVAPGDFATNIAAGRFTLSLKIQLTKNLRKSLKTMDAHVDNGSN
jgi:hypothetical protein